MFDEPYEIPQPEYYTFVYEEPNNGWWLMIDSVDKLADYFKKIEGMYAECFNEYLHKFQEYDKNGDYTIFSQRLQAIVFFAMQRKLTILDAIVQFKLRMFHQMSNDIRNDGYIVINKAGGYHSGPIKYSQFIHRKTFTWPDFKTSDIRITQFPGGTHYYVHIGDMELHEDDSIKWDTKEEAHAAAMRYINKED